MGIQLIIVGVCVALACVFMARKFYRSFKKRGCDCEGSCKNKTPSCFGGGECDACKSLREIKPK